jgi:opacity protein-like surface antigen
MKKLFLIALFIIAGIIGVNAQTDKGTTLLGGNISFQTSDGTTVFSANPNIGVFVSNKIALGAQFNLLTGDSFSAWAIGPFIRGYFGGNDKGKIFGQGGINIGGATDVDSEVGFGIGGGYAFFLNESVALELGANYTKAGDSDGLFTMGVGFQIHFKKRNR